MHRFALHNRRFKFRKKNKLGINLEIFPEKNKPLLIKFKKTKWKFFRGINKLHLLMYFDRHGLAEIRKKECVTHTGIHIGVNPLAWLLHPLEVHLLPLAHLVAVVVQRRGQAVSHLHLTTNMFSKDYNRLKVHWSKC